MRLFERIGAGYQATVSRARHRSRLVDHVWRTRERYADVNGGRLAAAIAYYAFFAVFALGVLLFAIVGQLVRGDHAVIDAMQGYLQSNLPQLKAETLLATGRQISPVALVGLLLAGVGWVESLRSSQRAIWRLDEQPGHPLVRWLVDLAVLVGLGVLLTVSVLVTSGLRGVLLRHAGQPDASALSVALRNSGAAFAVVIDLVLAAALLGGVPRLRMPLARLVPSTLVVTAGLELLKTVGRWYVGRTQHNPAYQLAFGAVGLLLFMYLFNQVTLYAAAFAATSDRGEVVDLARPPAAPARPDVSVISGESTSKDADRAAQ